MSARSEAEVKTGFLGARGAVRRGALVFAAVCVFALAVAFEVPLCPTATLFGVPCPGCGLTRGTLRLLHGDLAGALAFHPLAPLLSPLVGWLVAKAALGYVRGKRPAPAPSARSTQLTTALGSFLLVALLGVWGARFFGAFGGPVPVTSIRHLWLGVVAGQGQFPGTHSATSGATMSWKCGQALKIGSLLKGTPSQAPSPTSGA
jgi:hypothetical protein